MCQNFAFFVLQSENAHVNLLFLSIRKYTINGEYWKIFELKD